LREEIDPNKNKVLVELIKSLNQDGPALILVFTNTKWGARVISKIIKEEIKGLAVGFSNGNLPQNKRDKILKEFKNKQISLLVTTVLGRGVHVDNVDYVINYGVPQNPEAYTHRIGRTGRAGSKGVAITLVGVEDEEKAREQIKAKKRNKRNELNELLKITNRQKFKISEYKLTSEENENHPK
jgi:ATP-dependent RNA helicase RhlB